MSEELQGGYQTTNEPVSNEPQQQEISQSEPSSPQESNFFEVKYNKEPVKVSYDEAPTYIQKGMNYDKVQQQVQQYQQRLQDLSSFFGYQTEDEVWQALEQAKQEQMQQQQQELYSQAGIDPETFNQILSNHPAIQYANQLQQRQQEEQQLASEWGDLVQEFPDMTPEKIPPEVFQLQQSHPNLSLLDAYLRVSYKSLGQQKEQEAIQKLQQNQLSTPGALGSGADHITSYSQLSAQDKKALRERVLRGENVQL
jgi:hypothetical protein